MARGKRTWLKTVARYTLAVGFLALVYWLAGGVELPADIQFRWLVLAGLVFLSIPTLEATAWWTYLAGTGSRPSWLKTFRATLAAGFTAQFLPSPAPSLTRPLYLKDEVSLQRGLATTVVDRLNTLLLYGLLLILAGGLLWQRFDDPAFLWLVALALVPLGLFGAAAWGLATRGPRSIQESWVGWVVSRVGGIDEWATSADETLDVSSRLLRMPDTYRRGLFAQVAAIALGRGLTIVCLAVALGASQYTSLLVLVVLASLALALVPFLPQGLGAVEGFGTYVLSQAGMPAAEAFTFLLAWRGLVQGLTLLLGGFAFFDAGVDLWQEVREASKEQTPG